ncbi:MAG: hypothetical protein WD403_06705 [Pirellulales bacterium]
MKTRYYKLALLGSLAVVGLVAVPSAGTGQQERADQGAVAKESKPRGLFAGKIIAIAQRSSYDDGAWVLRDVTVELIGDKQFLVGTGAETGIEDWMDGLRIWVSIEDIADITEFESVEQYKERMAE